MLPTRVLECWREESHMQSNYMLHGLILLYHGSHTVMICVFLIKQIEFKF